MELLSIQSSVAFGHVGNSAAVFPLQRLGIEVWPVNTVEFSNHTGYGSWKGPVLAASDVADILEGITRDAVMELAERELDMPVERRDVDRTELYAADEVFLTGTGYQIAPVVQVDGRPVGTGEMGPVAARLQELYFKAARGEWEEYADWTVAIEVAERAAG